MTDTSPDAPLQGQADEGAPVPVAAPAPGPAARDSRIGELEAELTRLRNAAVTGAKVLLRVLPPHVSFIHAGRTIGREPVPVPVRAAAEMQAAAARSGVTLSQEEV